jgi:hypothetical protein
MLNRIKNSITTQKQSTISETVVSKKIDHWRQLTIKIN